MGSDHPDTLTRINNYAMLLKDRGHHDEAEVLYREALTTSRRIHGDMHPDTLTSVHNMAVLLQQQGRLDAAEVHFREALAGRQIALGAAHTDTRSSSAGLEGVLRAKAAAAVQAARRGGRRA